MLSMNIRLTSTATNSSRRSLRYWQPFYNKHIRTGGFLRVEFPGSFLVETLVDALGNFKKALKGKRTLPAAIFFQVCDPVSETEYLDIDSLPEGKDGKISF